MATQNDPSEGQEEGEASERGRPGTPLELSRLLKAIRRGRWPLLIMSLIGCVLGVALAKFFVTRSYETTGTLRFEGVAPLDGSAAVDTRRELPARTESFNREPVLARLRERLEMYAMPLDVMRLLFQTNTDAESGLISITGTGSTPEAAANMANVVAEIFIEHERERRRQEIEGAIHNSDELIRGAQLELDTSRTLYDAFRAQHGVTDLTVEQEAALTQAAELRAQANLAEAEVASLEARVTQLQSEVRRAPRTETITASGDSPDRTELARAQTHAEQLRGRLSGDHPELRAAEAQVDALQRRVASGRSITLGTSSTGISAAFATAQTALATAQADLEGTRQRRIQLQRLAEEAQERVTEFSAIEGDASALLADVEVKRTLLSNLQNNRARLVNMLENPDPGFRVIARATNPESPVPSKRKLYVAVGVPAGFVLITLLLVLFREFRGFRLHTASEIAFWGRGPVVGTTTWPRDPQSGGDLVADMDDFVPEARGTMLIVGATEKEAALASDLAKQLSSDWTDGTMIEMSDGSAGGDARDTRLDFGARTGFGAHPYASHENPLAPPHFGRALPSNGYGNSSGSELLGPPSLGSSPYAELQSQPVAARLVATAWTGPLAGQQLRRAARLADRVLIVVPSGAVSPSQLSDLATRLGRRDGVGFVIVGVADEYATLPDRAGSIEAFWNATKE